uniref:Splicing factor 45 n=1 Tax=Lygus hesperus TaxID=30085 RepID=A0A0A9XNK2_LYGHE
MSNTFHHIKPILVTQVNSRIAVVHRSQLIVNVQSSHGIWADPMGFASTFALTIKRRPVTKSCVHDKIFTFDTSNKERKACEGVKTKRRKKREERERRTNRSDVPVEEPKPLMSVDLGEPDDDGGPPAKQGRGGVAIAPPPSLVEQIVPKAYGASVAAKIMAKYGFKEGQGLGKKEQGISMALQVEKTSKRGGRIVHEKDVMLPPPPPSLPGSSMAPPPAPSSPPRPISPPKPKPITEIMKTPSKVVLLKNMVGPGEVDEELEPEVKDECNTKYGDVVRVIIYELPNVTPEEAVRIFVEFKRIESAIKAVVDLNGRFFGGRQVMAGFYPWEKLENLELLD